MKRWLTVLLWLSVPLSLFALYTWASLTWVYSAGERIGYVQKLSYKGWLCKTWEGELVLVTVPGTQAEKFYFTVPDSAVVARINALAGARVRLQYQEHKGVPSQCFGETGYFVQAVEEVKED